MSKKGRGKRAMEVDGENEEDKRNKMVGFMFGNVDKKGRLDEDYLEEEAKENLDALDGRIDTSLDRDTDRTGTGARAAGSGTKRVVQVQESFQPTGRSGLQAESQAVRATKLARDLDEDEDYDMEEEEEEEEKKKTTATTAASAAAKASVVPKPESSSKRNDEAANRTPAPAPAPSGLSSGKAAAHDAKAKKKAKLLAKKKERERVAAQLALSPVSLKALPSSTCEDDMKLLKKIDEESLVHFSQDQDQSHASTKWVDNQSTEALAEGLQAKDDVMIDQMDRDSNLHKERTSSLTSPSCSGSTFSRFRSGVPLAEALAESQADQERKRFLSSCKNLHSVHPALNQNWEKDIQWSDETEEQEQERKQAEAEAQNSLRRNELNEKAKKNLKVKEAAAVTFDEHIEPLSSAQVPSKIKQGGQDPGRDLDMRSQEWESDAKAIGKGSKVSDEEQSEKLLLEPILYSKLESNQWVDKIRWDSENDDEEEEEEDFKSSIFNGKGSAEAIPPVVELDLDDKNMVFEIMGPPSRSVSFAQTGKKDKSEGKESKEEEVVDRKGNHQFASIILPKGHTSQSSKGKDDSEVIHYDLEADLKKWRDLSNDKYYKDRKKELKSLKDRGLSQKVWHSQQALKMQTMRLTETMTTKELKMMHRPRGAFIPPKAPDSKTPSLRFGGSYHINAKISSLVGYTYDIPNPFVANATTVDDLWKTAKQLQPKLQRAFKEDRPKLMLPGLKRPLKSNQLLGESETGLNLKGDTNIWMLTNKISFIKNANYKKFQEPLRPPGAFKNARDLSVRDGHLFLLEYVEEHPLLLSNQGMGLRLLSFYRKQHSEDQAWKKLKVPKVVSPEDGSWGKYGRVIPLAGNDDPPFLGDVPKGQHQLGVDCNLFRAPAFYHPVQSTDFLMIRTHLGRWIIRELSSNIVVGQQEPRVKTPWPGSVQIRDFEEKRFQDHVFRFLRKKTKEQAAGGVGRPELLVQHLKILFPNNSEQLIRNRLRGLCGCIPVNQAQADGRWHMKPGARIPEEIELRQLLTPEMVCAYESMRSSQERLADMGIKRHELLRVSNERLKLATELLPDGEEAKKAARFIEQMIQIASWSLISNYLDVMKDGRGTFSIGGLGDPSGRGRGFSYVKAPARGGGADKDKEKEEKKKSTSTIAGTKTDLRRLSMGKAEQILKTLGVPEDEIKQLTRWNRINLIQRLSTAAAADGSVLGNKYGGFARTQRKSAAEAQRVYQLKCQDVFRKQALALSEAEVSEEPDESNKMEVDDKGEEEEEDDLANELENMLEDDDEDEEENKGKTEEELLAEDEEEMKRLKEEGLFGEKKKAKSKEEKKPKKDTGPKRRLRRIFKMVNIDGTIETKEVIITDPNRIETLRMARANYGGFGEGGGMINLTKERKRLQDRHLKLKKRIKKQQKHMEMMRETEAKLDAISQGPADVSGTKLTFKAVKLPKAGSSLKVKKAPKKRKLTPEKKLNRILRLKVHMPIKQMPISNPFASKKGLDQIKDYPDFVSNPVTLADITKQLHKNSYSSWMGYQADITQMVDNAKAYNDPDKGGVHKNPALIQQAEFLQILINLRIARYAGEIIEAQERCEPLLIALRNKYKEELPWVKCSRCNTWRLVSFEQHQNIQATIKNEGEAPWYCENNIEREDPSCSDQADQEHFNNLKNKYLVQ